MNWKVNGQWWLAGVLAGSVWATEPQPELDTAELSLELLEFLGSFSDEDGVILDPETMQPMELSAQTDCLAQPGNPLENVPINNCGSQDLETEIGDKPALEIRPTQESENDV